MLIIETLSVPLCLNKAKQDCPLQCQAQLEQNSIFLFYFPIKKDNPNCYHIPFPNPNPPQPKVSELMERRNLLVISLKKFVGGGLYDYSVTPGSGLVKSQK